MSWEHNNVTNYLEKAQRVSMASHDCPSNVLSELRTDDMHISGHHGVPCLLMLARQLHTLNPASLFAALRYSEPVSPS